MIDLVSFTLTPGIEQRISNWQKEAEEAKTEPSPCITLSREFGCEAYPVAEKLQQKLSSNTHADWLVLDAQLLDKIAKESGYFTADTEHSGDMNPFFHSLVSMLMGTQHLKQFETFPYIKQAIHHFAQAGNCIIIGRGGVNVTRHLTNCIHVRLIAPLEFRIKKRMELQGLDRSEAIQMIKERQMLRDEFINSFTGSTVNDPALYHLVINNEKYIPDQIANIIECTVSQTTA